MMLAIARREFAGLFATPTAWLFIGLCQGLLAWVFLRLVEEFQLQYQPLLVKLNSSYGATDLIAMRFLGDPRLLILLLLAAALLAMRLLAEERRGGTLPLLLAAPVSSREIVLGKFLGGLGFLLVLLLLWTAMPLSLVVATGLDFGKLAAAFLGLALLAAALLALALWISAWTAQPALAALGVFIAGLFLMVLQHGGALSGEGAGVLNYLSLLTHLDGFLRGAVASADLAYYLLLTGGLLALAVRRLDALRVQA